MDKSFITWADYKSSFKWNSKRDTEIQSALDAVTASFSSELGENLFVTWASVNSPKHPCIGLEVQIHGLDRNIDNARLGVSTQSSCDRFQCLTSSTGTIRSDGAKSHMLVSKLHRGTSKTKAGLGGLARIAFSWKSH